MAYAVRAPWNREVNPHYCRYYASTAREALSKNLNRTWKELYRKGWRVVKVEIKEVRKRKRKGAGHD